MVSALWEPVLLEKVPLSEAQRLAGICGRLYRAAVGAGMYIPAIVTSILVLFVLIYFVRLEERFTGMREYRAFSMIVDDIPG